MAPGPMLKQQKSPSSAIGPKDSVTMFAYPLAAELFTRSWIKRSQLSKLEADLVDKSIHQLSLTVFLCDVFNKVLLIY